MVKFVEYTGSDGKTKMVTEGSYQQAVRSGKVSAEQHASAKGAKSSSDKYVQSSSSKSSSSSSSKSQQEVIPSNTQITFTDIGGKTQTTDYSTYKKWEKAGNVKSSNLNEITDRLTGDSSIGADTVAKLIDEQVRSGQITAEEGAKRKGEAYASEGAIVQATTGYTYKSYSSPNTYVEQQYINPRVQEFLYSGKTTPEAINQEMSKDYVQRTAFVSKYGGSFVGQDNLPRRYTDEYVYSPLAKFGSDNYSQSQIDLISKAEGEYMGRNDGRYLQLFNIDNNGIIVYNSNLSPSLRAEAERLANKYQINVGDKLNTSSQRPNQSSTTSTSNDQFNNPSDNLANYENEIYKNDLYKPAGSNVYYEASGDKYVPKYIEINGKTETLQTRVINGETEYFYEPPLPKDIIKIGDNQYKNIQTNVVYTEKNGSLIPSYLMKEYDSSKQMSGYDKIFFTEKDGEYFIENTTETITSQIPEGFTKVNIGLELPDILKQKMGIKEGILKDLPKPVIYKNGYIYYKTQGDKLIPSYTYYNGEKIYASKVGEEYQFTYTSKEINKNPDIERMEKNIERHKLYDYLDSKDLPAPIRDTLAPIISNVRDTTYKFITETQVGYEEGIDRIGVWYTENFENINPIVLSTSTGTKAISNLFPQTKPTIDLFNSIQEPFIKLTAEYSFGVLEIPLKTPSKIIGGFTRGGYEGSLYQKQLRYGIEEADLNVYNIPYTDLKISVPRSAIDSSVLNAEAGMYTVTVLSGVASGVSQYLNKGVIQSSAPSLSSNIAKTSIFKDPIISGSLLGAGLGVGTETISFFSKPEDFDLMTSASRIARTSGNIVGFMGLQEISRVGTITSLELGEKGIKTGLSYITESVTLNPKDKGIFGMEDSLTIGKERIDYNVLFERTGFKKPIREFFGIKEKDMFATLPFERIETSGYLRHFYTDGKLMGSSFEGTGKYIGQTADYLSFGIEGKILTLGKHQYFGKSVGKSLTLSNIENIGQTNIYNYELTKKAIFDVEKSVSQTYFLRDPPFKVKNAPQTKSLMNLDDAFYQFKDIQNNYPLPKHKYEIYTGTGYTGTLNKVEDIPIYMGGKIKSNSVSYTYPSEFGYINMDILAKDVSLFNPEYIKEIKVNNKIKNIKDVNVKRIDLDSGLKSYGSGYGGGEIVLTITETRLSPSILMPSLYEQSKVLTQLNTALSSTQKGFLSISSLGTVATREQTRSLENQKVRYLEETKKLPSEKVIERSIVRQREYELPSTIKTEITKVEVIPKTIEKTFLTERIKIVPENIPSYKYYDPIPIKPIKPIPPIPIPPVLIGGGSGSLEDYFRWPNAKKGGILDKRIRLSSISAGTFGTRARPEWRGTSLDTREDVLPARRYNSNQNTGWVTQIQTGIKKAKLVKQPKVKSAKLYKGSRSNTNKK